MYDTHVQEMCVKEGRRYMCMRVNRADGTRADVETKGDIDERTLGRKQTPGNENEVEMLTEIGNEKMNQDREPKTLEDKER